MDLVLIEAHSNFMCMLIHAFTDATLTAYVLSLVTCAGSYGCRALIPVETDTQASYSESGRWKNSEKVVHNQSSEHSLPIHHVPDPPLSLLCIPAHLLNTFLSFFIVILLQLSQFSPICPPLPIPPPPAPSQFPHCCLCPWVIHTCSLTSPVPFFPPLSPSPLPSGHCQSVPCCQTCGSILFVSLCCSLDSTYK